MSHNYPLVKRFCWNIDESGAANKMLGLRRGLPAVQRGTVTVIPNEVRNQFSEIISHEMFEMNRSMGAAFSATEGRASALGTGLSGRTLVLLAEDAVNSLKARSQFILGQLLRCLAAHRVPLTEETVAEASMVLRDTINAEGQLVRSHLFARGAFHAPGMEAGRRQIEAQLGQEAPRLITRLATELKLAAAASNVPPASSDKTYNFSGPIGVVQTGDGSQATVTQHLDSGARAQIVQALQSLLDEIDREPFAGIPRRAELRELILETKTEAEKPRSNTLKLGANLRTIAETTKFVGTLGPAYQVIKPLLSYFGIHLP